MLSVENLQFHYPGGPKVLKKVNFALEDGEFLAILGNNGAGKSTMLKCFNHIITPDAGEVRLNGENLLKMSAKEAAKRIAFVAQNVPNAQMTVHDMVMLGRRPYMSWTFTEKLLLLDEPTSSLDLKNQYQVLQIVKDICHETGISAIVVIHDLNLALRFCDRFLLMQQGEVYRYGDAGILDREAIWNVYGVHGEVVFAGNQKVVIVDK